MIRSDNYWKSTAMNAAAITPSNTVDLPAIASKGVYVGVAGAVKVDTESDTTVTFVAVPAGAILPVSVKRVYATGTAATDLVALY